MPNNPKSFSEQLDVVAVTGEVFIVVGCTLLIFFHYANSAQGLSVISCAGVFLMDFVAIAGLHFFLKRHTPLLKGASFAVWLALTTLTAVLAATVWMAGQKAQGGREASERSQSLRAELDEAKSRSRRKAIQEELTAMNKKESAPLFEKNSTWAWLYERGVHSLPFPCGIAGLAILLALGVWKSEAESTGREPVATQTPKPTERPTQAPLERDEFPQTIEEVPKPGLKVEASEIRQVPKDRLRP